MNAGESVLLPCVLAGVKTKSQSSKSSKTSKSSKSTTSKPKSSKSSKPKTSKSGMSKKNNELSSTFCFSCNNITFDVDPIVTQNSRSSKCKGCGKARKVYLN